MSITLRTLGVLTVAALLTACGTTPMERTATGAATGAGIAVLADEDAVDGALIGAALGATVPCLFPTTSGNCY